ncbi:MAG: SDR family NAD(P)-dependent oxidoreductase [Oscillospiraceae bacterium]|nr:SDR family NAD(P)-dependent oxidoreductase [Oscillospiraceae bacterium]
MTALITGASSGIGRDMAIYLGRLGWNLILVGRNEEKLKYTASRIKTKTRIVSIDLAQSGAPQRLYKLCSDTKVDFLINNAGFGLFGEFDKTDLNSELELIDVNIKAVHILTKLFLRDFKKRNSGRILNVASSAAFMPGPLLSAYYASKAYVLRLSCAIAEELKRSGSKVSISVFCPGPVNTDFNNRAGVVFSVPPISSDYAAKYAVDGALKRKLIIIPTVKMKLCCAFAPIVPTQLLTKAVYHIQRKKLQ